jgi:hypothetical protein
MQQRPTKHAFRTDRSRTDGDQESGGSGGDWVTRQTFCQQFWRSLGSLRGFREALSAVLTKWVLWPGSPYCRSVPYKTLRLPPSFFFDPPFPPPIDLKRNTLFRYQLQLRNRLNLQPQSTAKIQLPQPSKILLRHTTLHQRLDENDSCSRPPHSCHS